MKIWIAIATYGPESDIEPLVGIGRNEDEARDNLAEEIRDACSESEDPEAAAEEWIELPLYTRDLAE